jgi:DUF4097 and DUF4098 domain-containing protein YvlB
MRRRLLFPVLALVGLTTVSFASAATWDDSQSFDAPRDGAVKVDVSFFDVTVEVIRGDEITVEARMKIDGKNEDDIIEAYALKYEERNGVLRITSKSKKKVNSGWSLFNGRTKVEARMVVGVPQGIEIEIGTASGDVRFDGDSGDVNVELGTASGDVDVDGAATSFAVGTASGDITMHLSGPAERVTAGAASGDIRISGGEIGRVRAESASGDVTVDGLTGEANLSSASGDVTATWDSINGDVEIEASSASGDVRLSFPRGTELDGYADTSSGDIDSDFPGDMNRDQDHLRLEGGNNAVRLEVDTASGDIKIRRS